MLETCGLESKQSDSKNIAQVVINVHEKGYSFTQGMTTEEVYDGGVVTYIDPTVIEESKAQSDEHGARQERDARSRSRS